MTVQSKPMPDQAKTAKRQPPSIGFLRPSTIERAFVAFLYLTMLALVVLSVLGTFYGWQGKNAPLTAPLQIWADLSASGGVLVIALVIQGALSLAQYGARAMARHDRRWWFLYLLALGISVYYNVQAYWTPLSAMLAWYVAAVLILAGDVLPEFLAVKHND